MTRILAEPMMNAQPEPSRANEDGCCTERGIRYRRFGGALLRQASITLLALVAWPVYAATVLIDVRTPGEFASGHLPGALNIEYQLIGQQIAAAGVKKDDEVILYCRSGRRSGIALQTLRSMGFSKVEDYGPIDAAQQRLASKPR